uniref:Uncharacterized protein n=1 Tax=Athene cunicularia TaxID=194338 RepID=A0A663M1S6_ATHCN
RSNFLFSREKWLRVLLPPFPTVLPLELLTGVCAKPEQGARPANENVIQSRHCGGMLKQPPGNSNTPQDAQTHPGMLKHTAGCSNTPRDAQTHPGMHKHTPGCSNTPRDAQTHPGMHKQTPRCTNTPRDEHTPGCTNTPRDAQTHPEICTNTPRDAQTHPGMHKHTPGCTNTPQDAQTPPPQPVPAAPDHASRGYLVLRQRNPRVRRKQKVVFGSAVPL